MGKYAKMIVNQACMIENIIKAENFRVNPNLLSFIQICQRLYKAIALWSLFFIYLPKLKTNAFNDDENMDILAGGCISMISEISRIHKEIMDSPTMTVSEMYGMTGLYFKNVFIPKSKE